MMGKEAHDKMMAGNDQHACKILLLLVSAFALALGDTPANCTYEDIRGKWTFAIGQGGNDRSLNCKSFSGLCTFFPH